MKMEIATEILTTKQKDKKQQNESLVVSLLELILKKKTINEIFRCIKKRPIK